MNKLARFGTTVALSFVAIFGFVSIAFADHSWGNYHWARTTSTFTLKLGDNVTGAWDNYLTTASNDWSLSSVLDTKIVAGLSNRACKPTLGRVEVCNDKYGANGWLGIAQIWLGEGSHITQATTKLNDTYFAKAPYNTPAWRNLVMCQEIGHTFGLDHQDEDFNNANLGTCMDYTTDPNSNQHPNAHDYEQLAAIYLHLDTTNTVSQTTASVNQGQDISSLKSDWGNPIRQDKQGRDSVFEKDLGKGEKMITHVFWAE